jgi:hypothetical protein
VAVEKWHTTLIERVAVACLSGISLGLATTTVQAMQRGGTRMDNGGLVAVMVTILKTIHKRQMVGQVL